MRSRTPPAFVACSSRLRRLFLLVLSREDRQSGEKQAGAASVVALIRESEEPAKRKRDGKSNYLEITRTREASERGPRTAAKRRSTPFTAEGVTRTGACSLGAIAPRCASSAGSCELRAALCLAALGAARRLAWGMRLSNDFRDERVLRARARDGRKWTRGHVVDEGVQAAVYGPITSSVPHYRQPLMPSPLDGLWCGSSDTPHCNPFGTVVHGGHHA
jgi:hypothetical protein